MTKQRGKTIAVENEVWRELKLLSIESGRTLSETIDELLKIAESERNAAATKSAKRTRTKPGGKPGSVDQVKREGD